MQRFPLHRRTWIKHPTSPSQSYSASTGALNHSPHLIQAGSSAGVLSHARFFPASGRTVWCWLSWVILRPYLMYAKTDSLLTERVSQRSCGTFGRYPATLLLCWLFNAAAALLIISMFGKASSCALRCAHSHGSLSICCADSQCSQCFSNALNCS